MLELPKSKYGLQSACVLVLKLAVFNRPTNSTRGCLQLHPPSGFRLRAFIREIIHLEEFSIMPGLPIALPYVVENIDCVSCFHSGIRIVVVGDNTKGDAVNFPS